MTTELNTGEETMRAALRPYGWTCGPDFWKRYHNDPWVFNLANIVERQANKVREWKEVVDIQNERITNLETALRTLREWDVLTSTADGPWAYKLIDEALQ